MSVVSASVCDLPMQIVSDRDRRRHRLFQIIWKPRFRVKVRVSISCQYFSDNDICLLDQNPNRLLFETASTVNEREILQANSNNNIRYLMQVTSFCCIGLLFQDLVKCAGRPSSHSKRSNGGQGTDVTVPQVPVR